MRALCAEKKAFGPRKRFDCSTLQSIADKESANRDPLDILSSPGVGTQRFVSKARHFGYVEPELTSVLQSLESQPAHPAERSFRCPREALSPPPWCSGRRRYHRHLRW